MSTTADHVFPREIFQKEHRDKLPKVPSCAECNNKKSKLEHYLLSVLPFGATHPNAQIALSVDVPKRLEKNRRLHREINKGFGYTYIPIKTSILEKRLTLTLNSNVLHEFIGYVGRGLIWHHWSKYLPQSCSYMAFTPSPSGLDFVNSLFNLSSNLRVNVELGDKAVIYKGVMSEHDDGVSIWAIQLLGGITLADEYYNHVFNNSFVAMITGSNETLEKLKLKNKGNSTL